MKFIVSEMLDGFGEEGSGGVGMLFDVFFGVGGKGSRLRAAIWALFGLGLLLGDVDGCGGNVGGVAE